MWFKKQKEIENLRAELRQVNLDLFNARASIVHLEEQNATVPKLKAELFALGKEIGNVKREKTEADLFFASAQIMMKLVQGATKLDVEPLTVNQNLLSSQLRNVASQAAMSPLANINNWFGLTGLSTSYQTGFK